MDDSPLARHFAQIARATIRVCACADGNELASGTAVVVAMTRKSKRAVAITAGHVRRGLEDAMSDQPDAVIRFEQWNVQHERVHRVVTLSGLSGAPSRLDGETCIDPDVDLGSFWLPKTCDDGSQFIDDANIGNYAATPVGDLGVPAPGTRVAWAGYPALLAGHFKRSVLCYYEGVVSAVLQDENLMRLVVDGHVLPGVSGGPLWFYHEGTGQFEVAAVVVQYVGYQNDSLPGFVFAQPIWPIVRRLEMWGREN